MTMPIEILIAILTVCGVLMLFIMNGFRNRNKELNERIEAVEKKNGEIVSNYVTRLDCIKVSISEVREIVLTGFGRIDGNQRVDDEKHNTLNGRIDSIESKIDGIAPKITRKRKAG